VIGEFNVIVLEMKGNYVPYIKNLILLVLRL
jgi:hypothetical protein